MGEIERITGRVSEAHRPINLKQFKNRDSSQIASGQIAPNKGRKRSPNAHKARSGSGQKKDLSKVIHRAPEQKAIPSDILRNSDELDKATCNQPVFTCNEDSYSRDSEEIQPNFGAPQLPIENNLEVNNESRQVVEEEEKKEMDYNVMLEDSVLGNLIREKALQIEENMNRSGCEKKIDMGLIESLKQKRKDSERQVKGPELDKLKEQAISSIQQTLLGKSLSHDH
mmetsp:Transcript_28405/g.27356  ORF Transcript_28405/g.27356 Transcript_28405/m.27356 type:complete len:226 (+) Transcript_28405:1466-2143(+)|eukprot:CAMPEP_0170555690 /NCGR_PEP_ID=MMETSP0211-20121228/13544_1 /TAXON_ID=311385 /ORGANISM="Pseudokeronopsis sp., Strain OXSARD2" /LENGTH=225 /DNA_ID=CAMNT_0010865661 /DNA_START=1465 /DNA_END=2142 /DNA_ORIENTATION=+